MAVHSGSLAGPAEAHVKKLANNHRKPGLCCFNNAIHKARRVTDAVKKTFCFKLCVCTISIIRALLL